MRIGRRSLRATLTPRCETRLVRVVGAGRALLEVRGGLSGSLALLKSSAVLVSAAIRYSSLDYEQAERRPNPSRPVAHTHAGLDRRNDAVLTRLATSGAIRGALVTITVTRADGGKPHVPLQIAADR